MDSNLDFFLGANTPNGFVSYFKDILVPSENFTVYLIKGGPGTGKSTFMKTVARELSPLDPFAEYIYCSSDPASLDGVIFHKLGIAFMDATPPHEAEPRYPGAFEIVINLCDLWDEAYLQESRKNIVMLVDQNKALHERATRFLAAAGNLLGDTYRLALEFTDLKKTESAAEKLAAKEIPLKKVRTPKEHRRFLSAVTDGKITFFEQTALQLCSNIFQVDDCYGSFSRTFLATVRKHALLSGYEIFTCACPLSPYDKIDHILIPELSLGFITTNKITKLSAPPAKLIHHRRFIDKDALRHRKARISFNKKAASQLLLEAARLIKEAKSIHDEIESYYIKAMDFDALHALCDKTISNIKANILPS